MPPGTISAELAQEHCEQRVFYCVATGPVAWRLHAYRKSSKKAPRREVELANSRMEEVLR